MLLEPGQRVLGWRKEGIPDEDEASIVGVIVEGIVVARDVVDRRPGRGRRGRPRPRPHPPRDPGRRRHPSREGWTKGAQRGYLAWECCWQSATLAAEPSIAERRKEGVITKET